MKSFLPASVMLTVLVATAAQAAPLPAPSSTGGSNITISRCRAKLPPAPTVTQGTDAMGRPQRTMSSTISTGTGLTIGYTNDAKVAAKEVDFVFGTAKRTLATVHDKGTFAPGVAVEHRFALPKSLSVIGLGDATCKVTRVLYADGSRWPH